jgi:beta-fructofuranosidase
MSRNRREFLRALGGAGACASIPGAFLQSETLRQRLAADPLRPQFHLLPAQNWMNDPNGPIYWKGSYHMFFQYNPYAAVWGDMHWAHAVSPDMIHWRHLPVALAPTPRWDDAEGCFTGSAVNDRGTATVVYTGVKAVASERATLRDGVHNFREVQCLATSSDPELRTWNKWKEPILQPPEDPLLTGFRDPFLWQDGPRWFLGVGSGQRRQGGRVLLYRSFNLRDWQYLHPLISGNCTRRDSFNPVDSGEMWECPDFFPLDGKHVLLYSTAGQVIWETGELDSKELLFHSQKRGVLDHGAYYAQKTQLDAKGNRILWGWIPETRPEAEFSAAGWAGCMALPRVLSLDPDGGLEMRFAPGIQSLRAKSFMIPPFENHALSASITGALEDIRIENLAGEFRWNTKSPRSTITLQDRSGPCWSVGAEPSGTSTVKLSVNGKTAEVPIGSQQRFSFHLLLDASVAEFICNAKHAFSTRIYRRPDGPLKISVSDSDLAQLDVLEAWQLRPISSDRLTS